MKRIALLCVLLDLAATVHATATVGVQPPKVFIMTAQHCDLLQEGTARLVEQRRKGMSLEGFKFSIENEYLTGPNTLAYSQIKPYLYAATEEYYTNPSLVEIDYASVIGRNCREALGRTAQ